MSAGRTRVNARAQPAEGSGGRVAKHTEKTHTRRLGSGALADCGPAAACDLDFEDPGSPEAATPLLTRDRADLVGYPKLHTRAACGTLAA